MVGAYLERYAVYIGDVGVVFIFGGRHDSDIAVLCASLAAQIRSYGYDIGQPCLERLRVLPRTACPPTQKESVIVLMPSAQRAG